MELLVNMSHYQGDDAEYMADEYEMDDVDDDIDEEFRAREMGSDSDIDEYEYGVCHMFNPYFCTIGSVAYRMEFIHFFLLFWCRTIR